MLIIEGTLDSAFQPQTPGWQRPLGGMEAKHFHCRNIKGPLVYRGQNCKKPLSFGVKDQPSTCTNAMTITWFNSYTKFLCNLIELLLENPLPVKTRRNTSGVSLA